jgi:hypothetical protein
MNRSWLLSILLLCLSSACAVSQQTDLNVVLMQNTFLAAGPTRTPGITTFGTVFLLLRPFAAQPVQSQVTGKGVLVTAAHVLEEMVGDTATIVLRMKAGNQWVTLPARFAIRRNGQALWKKLPDADVAVMYVSPPIPPSQMVPTTFLADDDSLMEAGLVPGVELKILGFPLATTSSDEGFPILRTGVIASYPLFPTSATKTFLLDFRVFKGNSGGPVYYSQPVLKGGPIVCCPPQLIMGLVSQEKSVDMPYSQLQLSLGVIVHASIIRRTIDLLPAPEGPEADGMTVRMEPLNQLPNPH